MIYMFLADGFEEVEALCPLDLMRRAGLSVTTVGVGKREIVGAHGITVVADTETDCFDASEAELVFLPGGMPGTLNLASCDAVIKTVKDAYSKGRYVAAICAAPSILGDLGMLRGRRATCYPGFEDRLLEANLSDEKVVVDGNVITATGMGVALEMGLALVSLLCGEQKAKELSSAIIYD